MSRPSRTQPGFTLVELMVVLVILALFATIVIMLPVNAHG